MSAMDVIVTVDWEGNYNSSVFYVLFAGKEIFKHRKSEKVFIEINSKLVPDIQMFKDLNGEVYFIDEEKGGANDHQKIPSQEYLRSMNLLKGENRVRFLTENTQQTAFAKIFLWDISVKIVVTDIDGTITRSDARGHLYNKIGLQWHHDSVSNCFEKVNGLGYQILYLTARSMKMDSSTRSYIEDLGLPSGPLLLSPQAIVKSFTSQIIKKDAKNYKLDHLTSVASLFPNYDNPFAAGFGNNENDEWAYRSIGIPDSHLFIVNKKSEISVNSISTTYEDVASKICNFFQTHQRT